MCSSIRPVLVVCLLFLAGGAAASELPAVTDTAGTVPTEVAADEPATPTSNANVPEASVVDASTPSADEAASAPAVDVPETAPDAPVNADAAAPTDPADRSSTDSAAAADAAPPLDNAADPLRAFNRGTFAFNEFADRVALRPLATAYRAVMPDLAERGVHNALENLDEPVVAINQLLQGKLDLAASDAGRFLLNSTVGLLGLIDVAAQLGLPPHNEDFGQTLGVWGVPQGPFLMLPMLGPSSPTTAAGSILDRVFKPTTWFTGMTARYAIGAVGVIDTRVQLLEADALVTGDRYTFIRDAYVQRRAYLQADGVVDDPFLDDAEDE